MDSSVSRCSFFRMATDASALAALPLTDSASSNAKYSSRTSCKTFPSRKSPKSLPAPRAPSNPASTTPNGK